MDNQNTNAALVIPDDIRAFLNSILDEAGITTIDADAREEIIKELFVKLDTFITASIVEHMPPENIEEFVQMNEDGKPQTEIEAYIKSHIENAGEMFAKAFADFKEEYLSGVAIARNAPTKGSPTN